ncbi:MAG: DUF411 domain-containing protein [Candidatus Saccharimonadales bacterium]
MKTSMKSNLIIGALVVAVIAVVGIMATQTLPKENATPEVPANGILATVYKSPSCGCCGQYVAYLEKKGYGVDIEDITDMQVIKEQYGVPYELESCHTMEIDGYVVEGHIPEEAVQKLLTERPDIKGIGMAGMPSGSPGMPGPKTSNFVIYEITHDGAQGNVFMTI